MSEQGGYRQSLLWLIGFVVCLQAVVVLAADLRRPPWGDESHFVETVRLFAHQPTLDTLRHYPEMSGPLPFALYAAWGRAAGLELWTLRLLSLLIAVGSYLILHRLVWRLFRNSVAAFLLAAFFAIHPYMVGFSIFVFTDGPAIFFLLLVLLAAIQNRLAWLTAGIAGALLCRQYMVFLVIALAVWSLLLMRQPARRRLGVRVLVACGIGSIPLTLLFLLWHGASPNNHLRNLYLNDGLSFHPAYLVLYISLMFYYLLPVLAFAWRRVYSRWKVLALALVLSLLYGVFPVRASQYAESIGVHTVGLFHKALVWLSDAAWFSHGAFFVGLVLGLPIVLLILASVIFRVRTRTADPILLLDLCILAFLLVMPFSYLNWEKYLIPLVPIVAVRLTALRLPLALPGKIPTARPPV